MSSEFFHVHEHIILASHIRQYPDGTANNQEDALKLAIKQYVPLDLGEPPRDAVTIIAAHANGYPKELYEPLWDELYKRSKQNGFKIRSIWFADATNQGQSGVLNEYSIGNDPSWLDHARDMLHMINHFRDQMPRPLVGIGHSMGGNQIVNLALIHPRLLTTVILLDPVTQAESPTNSVPTLPPIFVQSTFRRDIWPSRTAAAELFAKSPYYQAWDPRVFELWLKFGLRDTPTAIYPDTLKDGEAGNSEVPVTLTTTKHQEVWTFSRPNFHGKDSLGNYVLANREATPDLDITRSGIFPVYRPENVATFEQLPHLRPSALFLLGETSNLGGGDTQRDKALRTGIGPGGSGGIAEGRVKDILMKGVGHLIPQEAPNQTAEACAEWLGSEMVRWRKQEAQWEKVKQERGDKASMFVSKEWLEVMNRLKDRVKQERERLAAAKSKDGSKAKL